MNLLNYLNYFYVPKRKVSYKEFVDNVQTGDLFFMHGTYKVSRIAELVQRSLWSHVSILIRRKDVEGILPLIDDDDPLLIWESNINTPVIDLLTGISKNGPTLVNFRDRVSYSFNKKLDTKFAFRPLYYNRNSVFISNLCNSILNIHKGDFCKPISRYIFNSREGRLFNRPINDNTYFCSQLVAQSFIDLGLLSFQYPSNSYAPVDFTPKHKMFLMQRAFLGDEYRLNINHETFQKFRLLDKQDLNKESFENL